MASATLEPETESSTDRHGSADPGLDSVSRARPVSGRATLRLLIASHQPIVLHGLKSVIVIENARIDELSRAVRGAGTGQVVVPEQMAARMIRPVGRHDVLSHREAEIVHLVAHGLANKQVGRELGITVSTVKTHVSGIFSKLGLASRTQLALYAARNGLAALDHLGSDMAAGTHRVLVGA